MSVVSRIINAVVPEGPRNGPEMRKRVEWLMLLRLIVTTFLLGATLFFQLQESGSIFVDAAIPLYVLVGAIFLLSLMYALSLPVIPNLGAFSFFQIMVDVVYTTVVVYFTGGASSVFSLIYVFPIVSAGILHFRRGALFIASVSAILFGLLIAFQFHGVLPPSDWPWESPWGRLTPGYLLWVLVVHFTIFLIVALASSSVAEQLQRTRMSLNRREIDYQKLSDLHTNIVRSIPSGIITTDERDRVTYVNNRGCSLIGTSLPELISLPLAQIFPVIEDGTAAAGLRRETYRTVRGVGQDRIHMELTVSDLKEEDGTPRGRLVVFDDVTRMRKMEERVRVSEKQSAFVRITAGMAHEIRNPLASLRGAAELLSNSSPSLDSEKRLLGIVIREADRLNSLLSDFLVTVTSRQAKKTRLLLSDLAEETVAQFTGDYGARRDISVETLINQGVEVEGERAQIKQALWNILSNAADATPDGGVIHAVLESDPESGCAIFKVQDSGPGIPPEIRDRIFEPFTTTKERGTGIGLSLVLSVIEAHEGTVEVQTAPTAGTLFTIQLPLAPQQTELENG
ncbi:MAG: ATP-binding protein [Desulfomonilaceae bacterium]|nr:ATP-binding protein [Desulfomonilaceae bacterium]